MNGTSRLYRSTSEGIFGGVAAGLANYTKMDPMIMRIIFLFLMLITGGGFLVVYLLAWLIMPTPGSTASAPGDVVNENVTEMGNKIRSFFTGAPVTTPPAGNGGQPQSAGPAANGGQTALPPAGAPAQARRGITPQTLILVGLFFLLVNLGFFHWIQWGIWWPILLIGLGVLMMSRRQVRQ
jgi:phage shock protein PspC (stress-responsive transcriptional regulator)